MLKIFFKKDEMPTILLLLVCYFFFSIITIFSINIGNILTILFLVPFIVLHSSLQHECIHGHPTSNSYLNDIFVFPAIGLLIPYLRFKDTHLEHHKDQNLTDVFEDPESKYIDPNSWSNYSQLSKIILNFNNTLFGRIVIGPIFILVKLYKYDFVQIFDGDKRIFSSYIHHFLGLLLVFLWCFHYSSLSFWVYIISAYISLSILNIRTFLEHVAEKKVSERTVIIDDKGIFSLLFMNNNYHLVHHLNPNKPWYKLRGIFNKSRNEFLKLNKGYYYKSYFEIFKLYLFNRKDEVAHPFS